jgi:5-formyltetrahydrofolate cyclo-ligase
MLPLAPDSTGGPAAKAELRARLRETRRSRPASERAAAGVGLRSVLTSLPELRGAGVVTAYAPLPTEPDVRLAVAALRGVRVLLPVLLPDRDLDWVVADRPDEPLGPAAVATADVLLVPALAVDRRGARLGQGGGSYDRALLRARPDALVVAVLFDGELLDSLPTEPHDQRVDAVATPTAVVRLRAPASRAPS